MVSIYSQLLKEEYGDTLPRHALSYIDFAVNGAKRMSRLLTDLLAYSRVANASPEKSAGADARRAVDAALLNLATIVEQTGATVEVGELLEEIDILQERGPRFPTFIVFWLSTTTLPSTMICGRFSARRRGRWN